jgi:putative ABC transport system permease protein
MSARASCSRARTRSGQEIELNDQRAVIRGVVDVNPSFTSGVLLYTKYSNALNYVPGTRNRMTFVFARRRWRGRPKRSRAGSKRRRGCARAPSSEFALDSIRYVAANTGIPINFGLTVILGFIVGVAIVGLTFSLFIRDNIKQFGALKAIGVTNAKIRGMVSLQAPGSASSATASASRSPCCSSSSAAATATRSRPSTRPGRCRSASAWPCC